MARPILQVTIIYNSKEEGCTAQCGIDWSSAENVALVNQRIKERFDDKAEVSLIDTAKSEQCPDRKDMALPALIINGQLRISGQFDIRLLLDAIEAELEREG